MVLMEGGRG